MPRDYKIELVEKIKQNHLFFETFDCLFQRKLNYLD